MWVYSAIYCWSTDVISNVASDWLALLFYVADEASVWCKMLCLSRINVERCIRWGQPYSKCSFGEAYHRLYGRKRVAIKRNFRPYNRRYTSPNEHFKYSYPLIIFPNFSTEFWPLIDFRIMFMLNIPGMVHDPSQFNNMTFVQWLDDIIRVRCALISCAYVYECKQYLPFDKK